MLHIKKLEARSESLKSAVIYKSKTGFVKKYAQWIAEELKADIFEVSQADARRLQDYDSVIYGGSLHAVGIIGVKFITDNLDKLSGKKLAVFACGASPFSERVRKEVEDANFTPQQREKIKFFYLRGGFDYRKLPVSDKILMTLLKWKIKLRKAMNLKLSSDETGMFAAYNKPVDFTNKKYIQGVLEYIRS